MGVVYKPEDTMLKHKVVLKCLPSELTKDPETNRCFIRDTQAASALEHPNVCCIYKIGGYKE